MGRDRGGRNCLISPNAWHGAWDRAEAGEKPSLNKITSDSLTLVGIGTVFVCGEMFETKVPTL